MTTNNKPEKVAIFIPAYNVAHTLPRVIDRIPESIKKKVKEIFIIDNNSNDNTYMVGIAYKQKTGLPNLKIFKNDRNVGYGGSQKIAYKYAIKQGFDYIIMLHGDAQYAPEKIPSLLDAIKRDKSDLIFGSRMKGDPLKGGMPAYKFIGNKALTALENFVLNLNLSEYHSGFRIYRCSALKQVSFQHCSDNYDFDSEILIQFKIKGLKISEQPIPTHYGKESRHPSTMDLAKYCTNIVKLLVMYVLHVNNIKKFQAFNID